MAVINIHKSRSDVLILRDQNSPVLHVALPTTFTFGTAEALRVELVEGLDNVGIRNRDGRATRPRATITAPRPQMKHVLETLWTCVVVPVLSALGYMVRHETNIRHQSRVELILQDSPPMEPLPHITWCATGPLAFLPLHAAGLYDDPHQPKVFQYAISSYTPTLTALVMASNKSSRSSPPRMLAISQSNTPGHSPLPGTVAEIQRYGGTQLVSLRLPWGPTPNRSDQKRVRST